MSEAITETKSEQETVSSNQGGRDIIDQLLTPEVQESLTALVQQLPKLTELVNVMTKSYDFAKSVSSDEILKNDTIGAITEIAGPVKDKVKHIAANVIEAKDRADASQEVIGLFGLLKMLKDPEAQKIFRFFNAYLQVAGERNNQK
ncbi:DUF1641 domain-containing protein [Paenibacillus lutimineralis]|uniref:DUF1641 domain-containing protein n=1 Tax=Paenibacillus lutimineralis TaxID=2707005 RepID=A0A3S9V563_9BACL|nr:DUF1641 domain-containing protein [Paenibacillus lutimineralis]AZS17714.1 DUF1641 domain-containing protein [Paenibacillus lutimineralis]